MNWRKLSIGMFFVSLLFCAVFAEASEAPCPSPSEPVSQALQDAQKNAQQVNDPYLRSELLEQVAEDYVRNGAFPPAIAIIHTDSSLMWQASDDLAESMLHCDQLAELTAIVPSLNGRSRPLVLKRIAAWQAMHGRSAEAQKTVSAITDGDIRTDAQFSVILAQSLKSGSTDTEGQLRKLLSSSSHSLESIDDLVFQDLALVSALKGNLDGALAQLEKMNGSSKIYSTYYVIEATASKFRETDTSAFSKHVVSMVQPYVRASNQAYPLSLLAGALANIGGFDAGIQLANSIPNEQRRQEALVIIAVRLIEANNPERAIQVMRTLPPVPPNKPMLEGTRQLAWLRIAMAQTNAGNGAVALQTLRLINEPQLADWLRMQRAYALATLGRLTEAESTAEQLGESYPENDRGRALRLIAAVYAHSCGQIDAVKWAATLKNPGDRLSAYLGTADGLMGKPFEEIPPYFED